MIQGSRDRIELSMTGAAPVRPEPRWTVAGAAYPGDRCIHEIIEDQAKRTPETDAVVFEEDRLSYFELNRRANQLAHHLLDLGIGPEVPVALFLERSLELAVAVLALLKAGAVSVALDPDFPRDRISFMVEDSKARMIVTEPRLAHLFPPVKSRILCLGQAETAIARARDDNPESGVAADNLCAYVYTSGSTGTPKAVMATHRIASRIHWSHLNAVTLGERDRTLVTTSVGYGFFLGEFSSGLMKGATAVLARPGGYQDIDYLIDVVERHQITVISFVPTVLRHFLARLKERGAARVASLRHVVCQGEALTADLQEELRTSLTARVHKFYGLTEAPVAAYWDCREKEVPGVIVIGRPTDMEFHLLDEQMNHVPPGEPGEIYLSCPGMARGYYNRRALTAERFIPNPFSTEAGARLFRTGDCARWLADGMLEFLGRVDQQIKVRGVRIDLGEIEAILRRHPQVFEAVVVQRRQPHGDDQLHAFFVATEADAPSAQRLREFLAERMPAGLVPSAFIRLDELPRLLNGKVDRRELAARDRAPFHPVADTIAPRNEFEKRLRAVWRELFDTESIGVRDDFFQLGGSSIQAVRLFAEIDKALGIKLPPSTLIRAATIEKLAALIQTEESARSERGPLQLLKPGGSGPALFLVHDGFGETLIYLNLVRRMPPELAVYGIEPHRTHRQPIVHTRIADMAACYVRQIQRAQPEGPYYLGGMCGGGTIAHEMALQLEEAGHSVGFVALFDSVAPGGRPAAYGSRRSWASFRSWMIDQRSNRQQTITAPFVTASRKLINFTRYQLISRGSAARNRVRFRLLRAATDSGRPLAWYAGSLPVVDVYVLAMKNYQPDRAARAPVVLFRASEGVLADEPHALRYNDPLIGWGRWVDGGPEVCPVTGGHVTMLYEPNVAIIAKRLSLLMHYGLSSNESGS
jgi:amino acid adenylation domain-containing protein